MLYHFLYPLNTLFSGFNVFRYITFRTIGASVTAFLFFAFIAPFFIRYIRNLQIGQVIREDGPETHFEKEGIPTMGGLLILFTITNSTLLWADLSNYYVWLILGVTLWFGTIGAIDDFRKVSKNHSKGLSARWKLILQIIGALLIGFILYSHPNFDGHLSFPFFKTLRPDLGWGLYRFYHPGDCRSLQCSQSYRRPGRPGSRTDNYHRQRLPGFFIPGRPCPAGRLPADPFCSRGRRSSCILRCPGRQLSWFSLVQRLSCPDVYGRRWFFIHGRHIGCCSSDHQTGNSFNNCRRHFCYGSALSNNPGCLF